LNSGQDENSMSVRQMKKNAEISSSIGQALNQQITETHEAANQVLSMTSQMQRYAVLENYDSLYAGLQKVQKIFTHVDQMDPVADGILAKEQDEVQKIRAKASEYYANSEKINAEILELRNEQKEYKEAALTAADAETKQEYQDLYNAMNGAIGKKEKEYNDMLAQWKSTRSEADSLGDNLSATDVMMNEYVAEVKGINYKNGNGLAEDSLNQIENEIASHRNKLNSSIGVVGTTIASNNNNTPGTGSQDGSEVNQVNNQSNTNTRNGQVTDAQNPLIDTTSTQVAQNISQGQDTNDVQLAQNQNLNAQDGTGNNGQNLLSDTTNTQVAQNISQGQDTSDVQLAQNQNLNAQDGPGNNGQNPLSDTTNTQVAQNISQGQDTSDVQLAQNQNLNAQDGPGNNGQNPLSDTTNTQVAQNISQGQDTSDVQLAQNQNLNAQDGTGNNGQNPLSDTTNTQVAQNISQGQDTTDVQLAQNQNLNAQDGPGRVIMDRIH
jgi:hypothetical protein